MTTTTLYPKAPGLETVFALSMAIIEDRQAAVDELPCKAFDLSTLLHDLTADEQAQQAAKDAAQARIKRAKDAHYEWVAAMKSIALGVDFER